MSTASLPAGGEPESARESLKVRPVVRLVPALGEPATYQREPGLSVVLFSESETANGKHAAVNVDPPHIPRCPHVRWDAETGAHTKLVIVRDTRVVVIDGKHLGPWRHDARAVPPRSQAVRKGRQRPRRGPDSDRMAHVCDLKIVELVDDDRRGLQISASNPPRRPTRARIEIRSCNAEASIGHPELGASFGSSPPTPAGGEDSLPSATRSHSFRTCLGMTEQTRKGS